MEILDFTIALFRWIFAANDAPVRKIDMNEDIHEGGFRPLDLAKWPFNRPVATIHQYRTKTTRAWQLNSWKNALLGRHFPSGVKLVQLEIGSTLDGKSSQNSAAFQATTAAIRKGRKWVGSRTAACSA